MSQQRTILTFQQLAFISLTMLGLVSAEFESWIGSRSVSAQNPVVTRTGPGGAPVVISGGKPMPAGATKPGGPPGAMPGSPSDKKGKDGDSKSDDKKAGESPEPKVIRRGDRDAGEADPEELKATVGPDGKVAFQFRNQPWVDLVQWLAEIADQPLDWQELPGDRVNLRSPGRYSVAEVKDLFNRHLLARGYTLLELPGGITVAKTAGINPAMVPRVSIEELDNVMPHSFVRASLDIGWLSSEKLAEELKPMISSNGKLTALTTTNRIEAMDAAINLRQIARLLDQERNQTSRDALAPEFRLRHIPAETAKQMLEEFLGVKKKQSGPMTPQQMQMMQQMARQSGGKGVPAQKEPDISIVANVRQNSVFVRAPADRIAIAAEFIKRIDVASQGLTSLSDIESRVQVFRLYSIDPEKLIEIISEMNVLEPSTRIRADTTNGALIVSGSAADRFIIDRLIKRLDGSGRQFEVLQLRRLDAAEVAQSISFLMGKEKDDDQNSNSRRYFYYGYGQQDDSNKNKDEFRVAANARYRQVMLWANESEMELVRELLIKLGELPPPGGSQRNVRLIDASSAPETYDYLLQLRQQWSQISDTPLELPDQSEFIDPIAPAQKEDAESTEDETTDDSSATEENAIPDDALETSYRGKRNASPSLVAGPIDQDGNGIRLTTTQSDSDDSATNSANNANASGQNAQPGNGQKQVRSAEDFDRLFGTAPKREPQPNNNNSRSQANEQSQPSATKEKSPIQIRLDRDGNLVLAGSDTKALDQLENLMLQVAPPKRPYHVFKIKHQTAGYIQLNLTEYFEDKEEDSDSNRYFPYFFGYGNDDKDDGPTGLEKQSELRFVYDPDTNTIVVSGATSSQLRTISELIELWDVAEPVNKRSMRYTKLVEIKHGRAQDIAETVKEAYRDLLSSNDKTFSKAGRGGQGGGGAGGGADSQKSSGRQRPGSGLVDGDNGRNGGDVNFSFKGKLSMGIDPIGNTLLVSAEGEPLLELVEEMIRKLDQAAKPAGDMQIISIKGNTSEESIRQALKLFGADSSPSRPTPAPNANNQSPGQRPGNLGENP